jgi:hypothetical protein
MLRDRKGRAMSIEDPKKLTTSRTRSTFPPPDELSVGTLRRYVLHEEVALRSVSTRHLGRLIGPERFERTVAIERLRPPYTKDPECVSSLLRGARLAASVRHPNVIPVLDVVTGDEVLVVTEYVHGESLDALLRTERGRGARTPLAVASGVVAGVLRGLGAVQSACASGAERAHGAELTAPEVLVGTDGVARLMDVAETDDGQPPWFGAAVVLWEALAGRAFLPRTPEGFEAPSRYRDGLDPAVDAVVARGLGCGPLSAFGTAAEMALALEAVLPPAPPSQIGEWVESLAREALDERASRLSRLEHPGGPAPADAAPREPAGPLPAPVPRSTPPPPAVDPKSQVITRRLRSTPPPAATASDAPPVEVKPAEPGRAETTARIRRGAALRGKRGAALAAAIAGPALLLLFVARFTRQAPPAPRSAATAAAVSSLPDDVDRAIATPPKADDTTPQHQEEPAPSAVPRAVGGRSATSDPATVRRPGPPAAPDPMTAAKPRASRRIGRDDVL